LPAALIVIGGTAAATLVTYPGRRPQGGARRLARVPRGRGRPERAVRPAGDALRSCPSWGRRRIDQQIQHVRDPFLRNGLTLVADGVSHRLCCATRWPWNGGGGVARGLPIRLLESAAGYAPTSGILGAVLGLMRLMENLPSPAALGRGIALAFVATVYGIAAANLLLLPIASRLRERCQHSPGAVT
jgi:chemotaxis protein MotA